MTATKASRRNAGSVTSVDVARAVGVSQSVVSRAFSLHSSVAAATREQIFAAADRLGYRPNLLARSLITRRSNLFALVTGALANPLLLSVIESFSQAAQKSGYRVLLFSALPGQDLDAAMADVLQYQPHGVLALAGAPSAAIVDACRKSGIPIVLLGRESDSDAVASVSCDNFRAGERVGEALAAAGHRRFAFVTSRDRKMSFSERRERGFAQALKRALDAKPLIQNGGSSYEGGYLAGTRLLGLPEPVDAIFCANDAMALGVMDAARREYGLRIPEDVSVVGFDDVPMASWASYQLCTVRQPVQLMVETAMELLMASDSAPRKPAGRDKQPAARRLLPGELVTRSSARLGAGSGGGPAERARKLTRA